MKAVAAYDWTKVWGDYKLVILMLSRANVFAS